MSIFLEKPLTGGLVGSALVCGGMEMNPRAITGKGKGIPGYQSNLPYGTRLASLLNH